MSSIAPASDKAPAQTPAHTSTHGADRNLTMTPTREVLDHEYDGIQEFDNPTPGWWHLLFFATVAFSIPYFVYYETNSEAQTTLQAYAEDKANETAKQFEQLGALKADEPTIIRMMGEQRWMDMARGLYQTNCQQCHGAQGQGLVGPNMTDDRYKNVKVLTDITKVITEGAASGAMPPWRGKLSENHIVLLSSYVASLRGKNLESSRPAEGDVIPPWPAAK